MKIVYALLFSFLAFTAFGKVIELEPLGESYPVLEADLIEYIERKAKTAGLQPLVKERFDKAFRKAVTGRLKLPKADKDNTRRVLPRAVLTQGDIFTVDRTGKKTVIYPNGFEFNPLDYTRVPDYYVINAEREKEVEWLLERDNISQNAMVILSEGHVIDFMERVNRPAYLLSEIVRKALYVEKTPSFIHQEGNSLVIREYYIKD